MIPKIHQFKQLFSLLKQTFALTSIFSIFNNDAHSIISQKGLEILNKNKEL